MKPFDIPTENLYKFAAVGGLALFIVCGHFVYSMSQTHVDEWASLQREHATFRSALERLREEISRGRIQVARIAENPPYDAMRDLLQLRDRLLANEQRQDSLAAVDAYIHAEMWRVETIIESQRKWIWFLRIGMGLGVFFSGAGFMVWYRVEGYEGWRRGNREVTQGESSGSDSSYSN